MGRAKELCDKRVAELKKSNGTLEKVSSYRSIEAKHTYLILFSFLVSHATVNLKPFQSFPD